MKAGRLLHGGDRSSLWLVNFKLVVELAIGCIDIYQTMYLNISNGCFLETHTGIPHMGQRQVPHMSAHLVLRRGGGNIGPVHWLGCFNIKTNRPIFDAILLRTNCKNCI